MRNFGTALHILFDGHHGMSLSLVSKPPGEKFDQLPRQSLKKIKILSLYFPTLIRGLCTRRFAVYRMRCWSCVVSPKKLSLMTVIKRKTTVEDNLVNSNSENSSRFRTNYIQGLHIILIGRLSETDAAVVMVETSWDWSSSCEANTYVEHGTRG
jgi:hypothetical protein